jgi:MioC protein
MPRKISILVGTMTGTAELVASEVEAALAGAGREVEVTLMDALFAALESERPDLSAVTYGLIALGDRTYKATFCQGGLKFDALLGELGAKRVGEPLLHDAASGTLPEDVAAEWSLGWAELLATGAHEVAA